MGTFGHGKRYLYGAKTARLRHQKQALSCIKMAFSERFRARKIAQNRFRTCICRQFNGLRLHTKTAVIYVLDGFNFKISESESVKENQNVRPGTETVTIRLL